MSHLPEALQRLREEAQSTTSAGKKFERLMKAVFEKHPGEFGPARFSQVMMWADWREDCVSKGQPDPGADIGIDLVAKQTGAFGGGLCAIQCKNYADMKVATTGVDKFLAASANTQKWTQRIFVSTTGHSKNAQKKLDDAGNATVITGPQIDSWPIGDIRDLLDRPEWLIFDVEQYTPRKDQEQALEAIREGLFLDSSGTRGRVIMPCGTGKSVVALWAAERYVGVGGRVLYLVPSIALMSQTMREWALQRNPNVEHRYLSVCSDSKAARQNEDENLSDLAIPPTTDENKLASELKLVEPLMVTCVFSTYQSLPKVMAAQQLGAPAFDLVICDEAHRTAGSTQSVSSEDTLFTLIHDNANINADRRLYMTATPRLYSEQAHIKASDRDMDLYSMDDESVFGPELYYMSFRKAIDEDLLTDYHVVVVAVDENTSSSFANTQVADLDMKTTQQLLGCWDALADPRTKGITKDRPAGVVDPDGQPPVRRAIAFTNTIKESTNVETYWMKLLNEVLESSDNIYSRYSKEKKAAGQLEHTLQLDVRHIDGKMNAYDRAVHINWLRDTSKGSGRTQNISKVLTNAKCLTEGVDVPVLDAVLFLSPKTSEIDVVQAVGRVMRRAEGKAKGYVVIPVLVPNGKTAIADEVLRSSAWKGVWQVLRALRAHDERTEGYLSSPQLTQRKAKIILIDNTAAAKDERSKDSYEEPTLPLELPLTVASAIVDNVSDKKFWPRWGQEVGKITRRIRERIEAAVTDPQDSGQITEIIEKFKQGMRAALRTDILSDDELLELIAQHIVTSPVLDALFAGQDFVKTNPISRELDTVYKALLGDPRSDSTSDVDRSEDQLGLRRELARLERFHERMRRQLQEVTDSDARLEVLLNLYKSFFKHAMPKETKHLGIAYTPIVLVDFVLRSVDAVCRHNLGILDGIGAEGVHVLDPFTGTGTFINRLLTIHRNSNDEKSDFLISDRHLDRKYLGPDSGGSPELLATELLLLAYYIAALKIEEGYRQRKHLKLGELAAFQGLVLTDTFLEKTFSSDQLPIAGLEENEERIRQRENLSVRAIIGNPPWSGGKKKAGDDDPDKKYSKLAKLVKDTYGEKANEIGIPGGKAMGNLYVKAIKWASDRLDKTHGGVVAFIHPNSLTDGPTLAGVRASLREEFTDIYIINLLGNANKAGEERKKEGENVFGGETKSGVQITVLVHNPNTAKSASGNVYYAKAPEYSSRDEKFAWLQQIGDILSNELEEVPLTLEHNWDNLGDESYKQLVPLIVHTGKKKNVDDPLVNASTLGLTTNCDTYVYSFSREELLKRVDRLIDAFNDTLQEAWQYMQNNPSITLKQAVDKFTVSKNLSEIKWTDKIKSTLKKLLKAAQNSEVPPSGLSVDPNCCRHVLYRPFTKLWLYEDDMILSSSKTVSAMFPRYENVEGIMVDSGSTIGRNDTALASGTIPDLHITGGGSELSLSPINNDNSTFQPSDSRDAGHGAPSGPPHAGGRSANSSASTDEKAVSGGGEFQSNSGQHLLQQSPIRDLGQCNHPRPMRSRNHASLPSSLPAIMITSQQNQIPFGVITSTILCGLHTTGRVTRAIPRNRTNQS